LEGKVSRAISAVMSSISLLGTGFRKARRSVNSIYAKTSAMDEVAVDTQSPYLLADLSPLLLILGPISALIQNILKAKTVDHVHEFRTHQEETQDLLM
jgi:hypothetical protein